MKKITKIFIEELKDKKIEEIPSLAADFYNSNEKTLSLTDKKEFIDYIATLLMPHNNNVQAIEFLNYLNWKNIPLFDEMDIYIYYSNNKFPEQDATAIKKIITQYNYEKRITKKIIKMYMDTYHREEQEKYFVLGILANNYGIAQNEIIEYVCKNASDIELKQFIKNIRLDLRKEYKQLIGKYITDKGYFESLIEFINKIDNPSLFIDMTIATNIIISACHNNKDKVYSIITNKRLINAYLKSTNITDENKEILLELLYQELGQVYPKKDNKRFYIEDNKIINENWDTTEYLKHAEVLFEYSRIVPSAPIKEIEEKLVECAKKNDLVEDLLIKFAKIIGNPNDKIIKYFIDKNDHTSLLNISRGKSDLNFEPLVDYFMNSQVNGNYLPIFMSFSRKKEKLPALEIYEELLKRKKYKVILDTIDFVSLNHNIDKERIIKEIIATKNINYIIDLIERECINIHYIVKELITQNDNELITQIAASSPTLITNEMLLYLVNVSNIDDVMTIFKKGYIKDYELFVKMLLDTNYLLSAIECLNNKPKSLRVEEKEYKQKLLIIFEEYGYDYIEIDKYFDNKEFILSHIDEFINTGLAELIEENTISKERVLEIFKSNPTKYKREILVYFDFLKGNDNRKPESIDQTYFNNVDKIDIKKI